MKTLATLLIFLLAGITSVVAFKSTDTTVLDGRTTATSNDQIEHVIPDESEAVVIDEEPIDSLVNLVFDTSTLKGKRDSIRRDFILFNSAEFISDTLYDVNYDGNLDLVIHVYASCGTGLKNGVEVFNYESESDNYKIDPLFSSLPNPSFYFEEGKVTSFYLAHGSGYGEEYHWIDDEWVLAQTFHVDNDALETVWFVENLIAEDFEQIAEPYQGYPLASIMKHNY